MHVRSVVREWVAVILRRGASVRQQVVRQFEPQYRETYQVRLESHAGFEIETVRE